MGSFRRIKGAFSIGLSLTSKGRTCKNGVGQESLSHTLGELPRGIFAGALLNHDGRVGSIKRPGGGASAPGAGLDLGQGDAGCPNALCRDAGGGTSWGRAPCPSLSPSCCWSSNADNMVGCGVT